MHQSVVDDKIKQAVQRHASTNPLQRPVACRSGGDQRNGQPGKQHRIHIVEFKPAGARFMVRVVPVPAPAVHDVPV